jgi:uncharacterized membrane protein
MDPHKEDTKMIGCVILGGLAGLFAVRFIYHRRHRGPFWGPGSWGGRHRHHHHHGGGYSDPDLPGLGWGRGRRWADRLMDFVSARLETSPKQERTIAEALVELQLEMSEAREEGKKTRNDLATALRNPSFDEVLYGNLYARHDDVILKARKAFVGFSAKVHETLDEDQRERLATMVERGGGFFGRGPAW